MFANNKMPKLDFLTKHFETEMIQFNVKLSANVNKKPVAKHSKKRK